MEARDRAALATVLAAIGLTIAGEFAIYMALPDDMEWQINTSLERLLLQLWPSGLLAFFLAAKLTAAGRDIRRVPKSAKHVQASREAPARDLKPIRPPITFKLKRDKHG